MNPSASSHASIAASHASWAFLAFSAEGSASALAVAAASDALLLWKSL